MPLEKRLGIDDEVVAIKTLGHASWSASKRSGQSARWLFWAALLVAPSLLALDPSRAITQYGLSGWTTDHGLPQDSVNAIAQTPDGYLWFGTQEGLARFDGARFKVFDKRNTPALETQHVNALLVTRDGSLWIGRNGGLTRYKDGQFTSYSERDGLHDGFIWSLSEGLDGSIWIATYSSGLSRFHGGKFTTYTVIDGLPSDTLWTTYVGGDGALWVGTNGGGLSRFSKGKFTNYTTQDGLANNIVWTVHQDRAGDVWIGTNDGLNRLHDGKFTTFRTSDGLSNNSVRVIREDRHGNLWIGTDGGGLNRLSGGKFTSLGTQHGLTDATVLSLYEDREGSLWVGTSAGGANQLRPSKFVTISRSEGLIGDVVWSVREAMDGSLLIGTNNGFSRWKDGASSNLSAPGGLSSNVVRTVLEDRDGALWLGTADGLDRYQDGKLTVYRTSSGLSHDMIRSLMQDREGNIWIGTRGGGLNRFRNGAFTVFNVKNGLANDVVASVDEDVDGSLWIATNGGVSVLKDGRFRNYSTRDGLSSDVVRVTYHDREGTHWIGTYGGGLNRIKNGRITPITSKDGLFDDVVFSILEDDMGYFWMTCNRGVFRVSRKELDDFADKRISSVHSVSYGVVDGMKKNECNGGAPAAWKGKDGRLYFPTSKGVAVIHPNNVVLNSVAPTVWNEDVLLDGKSMPGTPAGLTVAPGPHSLEIHYTALSFIAPTKVEFRYRLKGFSDDWVEAGNRRAAFYTNLPPGHYTFDVMGSNNDGVWGRARNPVQLHIQAAFFETTWFKIAFAICLLLAGGAAFRMRLRFLQERERVLVQRVDEQTADLIAGKDAAEAVAEINTQLRLKNELILNSIADGVFAVDLLGNISAENPAAARMLGWKGMELVGRPAHETLHHSTLAGPYSKYDSPMYKTMADGVLRQVSHEFFWRKDGTSFPVDYIAAPIMDGKQRVIGVAMTFRDVTEQKAVERLKSEFVSTVSHELRTPLTSIRGALGLLTSGLLGPVAEKGQRMLEIAVSNTDRLVRLINNILDLERIESGRVELVGGPVDANAVMVQSMEGVQSIADQAGVRLVHVPVAAALWGDSDRIIQTLTNLLGNAIKFSSSATTVTLSGVAGEKDFVFCVADQGRGVPEDKLVTIFERFSQVDASDSRAKNGSGLGLAICQSIVQAHGGRIWAETNDPAGSRFQFTIPLAARSTVTPPAIESPASRTVLVCQDQGSSNVMGILERGGFGVVTATLSDDVIARAATVQPDVILLDVADSGQGRQIVEALESTAETRHIPIVVATAQVPEPCENYAAAVAKWVRKPWENDDLIQALDQACGGPSIVVVEDDLDLARVMITALQNHGMRTFHAARGIDAVQLCRQHAPSLIVLELVLPDMDGFAVVCSLRESATLGRIPLLVYSALDVGSADRSRLRLGPTEFLTKSRSSLGDFEKHALRLLEPVLDRMKEGRAA